MSTLTVQLGVESVDLPLDPQLFVSLGLSVSNLIDMPQWWQRTSGRKLDEADRHKAWLWRDAVITALLRLKDTSPQELRAATKATLAR